MLCLFYNWRDKRTVDLSNCPCSHSFQMVELTFKPSKCSSWILAVNHGWEDRTQQGLKMAFSLNQGDSIHKVMKMWENAVYSRKPGIQYVAGVWIVVGKDNGRVGKNQFLKGLICWILTYRNGLSKGFKQNNNMIRIVYLNSPSGSYMENRLE